MSTMHSSLRCAHCKENADFPATGALIYTPKAIADATAEGHRYQSGYQCKHCDNKDGEFVYCLTPDGLLRVDEGVPA